MNAHSEIHNAPCAPQVLATLYFGTSAAGRETISLPAFKSFLADSVTPRFPGFSVADVMGYWKGEPEKCHVLSVLMDDSDNARHDIRTIAEHYKSRFNQEAVAYSFAACQFTLNCWPFGPVAKYHQLDKGTAQPEERTIIDTGATGPREPWEGEPATA